MLFKLILSLPFFSLLKMGILESGFCLSHGVFHCGDQLVVLAQLKSVSILLHEFHYAPLGGPSRAFLIYNRLTDNVY